MTPEDFEPTNYLTPCGTIRVYRDGAHWFADALEHGCWRPLIQGASSAWHCQLRALDALDLLDPEPDPDPYDDHDWLPF